MEWRYARTTAMAGGNMSENTLSASILLLCYRDAPYIRAALQSALAQTVPCEIIVSNDGSDDGTFELAQEIVANYRGPHRVSVRRNACNLGVAGHVNAALPLTHGDIVVMMAGDDVSYPHRVASILEAFRQRPQAMVLGSDFDGIDEAGHPREVPVVDEAAADERRRGVQRVAVEVGVEQGAGVSHHSSRGGVR